MHSEQLEEVVGLEGGLRVGSETDVESGESRVRGLKAGSMSCAGLFVMSVCEPPVSDIV